MIYNLTEKLKFNEDPKLVIKETELTVKSDAEVVLQLMDIFSTKGEVAGAVEAAKLLFSAADQKKLNAMHLKMNDYRELVKAATKLAMGYDPDEEEPSGE